MCSKANHIQQWGQFHLKPTGTVKILSQIDRGGLGPALL